MQTACESLCSGQQRSKMFTGIGGVKSVLHLQLRNALAIFLVKNEGHNQLLLYLNAYNY